jgi:predicted ribosomally synthesized peptide with SipW-like signal peptide
MKKKILALALVVAMLAVAIVSASLAYFTDEEYETNTFTIGEVDIALNDEFVQDSSIYPGITVSKKVSVTNTSETENDAFVRVHVAFPVELAPRRWVEETTDAEGNTVAAHYEFDIYGEDGLAIVTTYEKNADPTTDAANKALYNEDWVWTDIYSADIGSEEDDVYVPCVVFVATYQKILEADSDGIDGITTSNAISAITLNHEADSDITEEVIVADDESTTDKNEEVKQKRLHFYMDRDKDGVWEEGELRVSAQNNAKPFQFDIEVAAEAVQIEGLYDPSNTNVGAQAQAALNTAFAAPGEYDLSNAQDDNDIYWVAAATKYTATPAYPKYDHVIKTN